MQEIQENSDGRCLAGAVQAQEAENLAMEHVEVQVVDGDLATVFFGDAAKRDGRRVGRHAVSYYEPRRQTNGFDSVACARRPQIPLTPDP
jgi:hypothetical protein